MSTLGLLKLPSSGTTTVHAQVNSGPFQLIVFMYELWLPQNSTKNKKELAAGRNEYLKAKKEKKKAKWAEIEKEVG